MKLKLPPHETDVWREVGPRRIPQEQEDDVIALNHQVRIASYGRSEVAVIF